MKKDIFDKLFEIINKRKEAEPKESYVAKLMSGGAWEINKKIMEEAGEVCEAALEDDREHLIYEICDLLFHSFVQASHCNISLDEIRSELERRFGMSGLEEKARRRES